jgi:hypothetical protein
VNRSLWRQSQLTSTQGLFLVTDGIYQVRGADLSNMTLVESDHGVIVIDPLVSQECAAAALALYRRRRGDKSAVRRGTRQPCRLRRPRLGRRQGRVRRGDAAARLRRRMRDLA